MRKLIVTGHLGGDPEVKTTKHGTNYTTFRIGSTEYGEENTSWISVTVWDSALQNFCKNLKKGSNVIIDGDYTDRIYTSNKTGATEIGRDIRANAIYFGATPKKDDTDAPVETKQNNPVETPKQVVTPKTTVVNTQQVATIESDDELPF